MATVTFHLAEHVADGSAAGSLRGINAKAEDEAYAMGKNAVAFGYFSRAAGKHALAEGYGAKAAGDCSHAEGTACVAAGKSSHAEGWGSYAVDEGCHAEGIGCLAMSDAVVEIEQEWVEGNRLYLPEGMYPGTDFIGETLYFLPEARDGFNRLVAALEVVEAHDAASTLVLSGNIPLNAACYIGGRGAFGNHAEGCYSYALGYAAHAEGARTTAAGKCAHSQGHCTAATGDYSHAQGCGTIARGRCQLAGGEYNVADSASLLVVGNGTATARSNAMTLDRYGRLWVAGDVLVGSENASLLGKIEALEREVAALKAAR